MGQRRVRSTERYMTRSLGRMRVRVRVRPGWQAGASTASAFAHNLNKARELGQEIREGWHPGRTWLPRATWYSAWRACDAILRPSVRDGRLSRSPWFLAPETARRFTRFSAVHGVHFTTGDRGTPMVTGDDTRPWLALELYEFFESRARDRLKCCAACHHWFADETKNRAQRWCSKECHSRGWSRAARRAAAHAQYAGAKKGAR